MIHTHTQNSLADMKEKEMGANVCSDGNVFNYSIPNLVQSKLHHHRKLMKMYQVLTKNQTDE